MDNEDRTYVIDPEATDPDLLRSLSSLGDAAGQAPSPPRRGRPPRDVIVLRPADQVRPPSHPLPWLLSAYALGPFAVLLTGRRGRRRVRWAAALGAAAAAVAAGWVWRQGPDALGGGDRALLIQGGSAALAAVVWLAAWCAGAVAAARRCEEGPFARRARRRPVAAVVAGLVAPGLGLLLAGRRRRFAISLFAVGLGAVAGLLLLRRAAGWWAWHGADPGRLMSDLQLEQAYLVLAGVAGVGALAWLVSALEAGRLAAGTPAVRAIAGADRIPAAFLIALVALACWFRPLDAARGLDGLTTALADGGLRLAPLWTARAAAALAPGDPVIELRIAERQLALGRVNAAAATRQRVQRRWQLFARADRRLGLSFAGAAGSAAAAPPASNAVGTPSPITTGGAGRQ
ncbi:MAG: hypothetical protein R3D98_05520 [Candidatus Krumholzibacteriia bacterium]